VQGVVPAPAIAVTKSDNTFTGLNTTTISLGYGAQSLTLSATGGTSYTWAPSNGLSSTSDSATVFTPTSAGTYTFSLTALNQYGCSASTLGTITVIDVRSGKNGDKVTICHQGRPISVDKEGVADHLAHGDVLGTCGPAELATASAGDLRLTIPTAINGLTASPNPFTSQTDVSFTLAADEPNLSLDLYDLRGMKVQNVYSGSVKANQNYNFPVSSNLSPGVYFFRLSGSNTVLNFKVIKQ
jgi:PKD repeat protein